MQLRPLLRQFWQWFSRLGKAKKIIVILLVLFLAHVFKSTYNFVLTQYLVRKYEGKSVKFVLTPDKTKAEPTVNIPINYFSHRAIKAIPDSLIGGHTRFLSIIVGFPSMTPWKGDDSRAMRDDDVILTIRQGHEGSARYSLSLYKKHLILTGRSEFGLNRYQFSTKDGPSHPLFNDLFYFADTTEEQNSVYIKCNVSSSGKMPRRCKLVSSPKGHPISYNISIPYDSLSDWRETVTRMNALVGQFSMPVKNQ